MAALLRKQQGGQLIALFGGQSISGLELRDPVRFSDFDEAFFKRWIHAERAAFVGFLILLGLVLAGYTGRGPASSKKMQLGTGEIQFENVVRTASPSLLQITLPPEALLPDKPIRLRVTGGLGKPGVVSQITPTPTRMAITGEGLVAEMPLSPAGTPGYVTVAFRPLGPGRLESQVGLEEGPRVILKQAVLP